MPDDNAKQLQQRMAVLMDAAIRAQTQEDADSIFTEMLMLARLQSPELSVTDNASSLRGSLGYYAGYFGNDTRARVEKFYQCEHPFFGAIADTPPPIGNEAWTLGQENMTRHKRGESLITLAELRAMRAGGKHD